MRAMDDIVFAIQRLYPQVFLACHVRHVRRRSTPFALTEREASLLAHLDRVEPTTARELERPLGVGAPSMSAMLTRLERLGLVARAPRERDRRTRAVRLSERGADALRAGSVLDTERLTHVVAGLKPRERELVVRGLEHLARAARGVSAKERWS
ncbi:MAG: winged helix DNA-binding protein [Planctomycetes bacterium]|nr:winged helix DNA-binding protein [Planctomycetota bacterium]